MNKFLFLGAAGIALGATGTAFAADLPLERPAKASFESRFTWTGCYLGAHVGGAWERKDATDPVQLVQDNATLGGFPGNTNITTTRVNPSGAVIGGQIGCDYQLASGFVIGIEGAASGSTLKGSTQVALPQGNPGETALVTVRTDFMPALTGRIGYAVDHWLVYGKGGAAWANDKYSVTGTFLAAPFDFEGLNLRTGWTVGAGVEWAFAEDWSARFEYDYYDFGRQTVTMNDTVNGAGPVSFRQSAQTVKLGLNFHVWGWQ